MTDINHVSGSDRIGEAIKILENQKDFKYIVNLQGDMPNIDPKGIFQILGPKGFLFKILVQKEFSSKS